MTNVTQTYGGNNHSTLTDLKTNNKVSKLKGQNTDNVTDASISHTTAKKAPYEPGTEDKLKGSSTTKGKVSGEEKSSGDSDQARGPVIPSHK